MGGGGGGGGGGGQKTGIPGEHPKIRKTENSSPSRDSFPHSSIGGRLEKQTC